MKNTYKTPLAPQICWLAACIIFLPYSGYSQPVQGSPPLVPYDVEMTNYFRLEPTDVVARLQKRIEQKEIKLNFDEHCGYLLSLLKELEVPLPSQLLVFSKTSLQRPHISPKSPRAIFFNDKVYVAWIPGAPMIEIQSFDAKLGAVFYTLEQKARPAAKLQRNNRCLECHISPRTLDVPGPLIRSFETSPEGDVDLLSGNPIVKDQTPIEERWGGWFVTGTYGNLTHRGNRFGNLNVIPREPERIASTNLTELSRQNDLAIYPRQTSDIVALMILEHQTHMENLLTRLNYEAAAALRLWGDVRSLTQLSESFLKCLLFIDEAPILGPIEGSLEFEKWFEAQGPIDKHGHSLRQLDLETRLFKFPCSYLIYSDAFERLPYSLRQHLYHRIWSILTGEDHGADYQKISAETKRTILEILTQTKSNLPAYWNL